MYSEIKKHLEKKISRKQRFSIERIAAGDSNEQQDTQFMSEHIASNLKERMSDMYDDEDASEAATLSHHKTRDFGGLASSRQMEKHFIEQLTMDISIPMKTFDFTVPNGSNFFSAPYDRDWSEGNGMASLARFDGTAYALPKANGVSAAGVGFYLTTNEPVLAAITPGGTYDWSWVTLVDLPFARSRGGMGITIYTDSVPQPTLSSQPVLWSVSGMTKFSSQKGSGRIADAASPAFGLGAIPLAPVYLHMVPGSRYLVWVWCWQTLMIEDNRGFISSVKFSMPFVIVKAGPPVVIH